MTRVDPDIAALAFVASAAAAAERLGVFAALPCALDELPERLGASARLHALIDLLVGGRRLVRDGDVLRAGEPGSQDPRGAAVIAEVIRRGRAFAPAQDSPDLARDARHLDVRPLLSLGAVASALDTIDRAAAHAVFLDAGGGLGDATRWFLARSSGRAILVDVAPIIDAARRHLADLGDRITFVAADLRTAELPRSDLAFVSNVLHLHPEPDAMAIVDRVARAVDPGGLIAIKDVAVDDDRTGPLAALAFGLACQIFGDGRVPTCSHLANYLDRAGATKTSWRRLRECAVATGRIG
ncbi:MAG: class I SAM-dependent methyltransferase [Kofleriaceae bacterium]